MTPAFAPASLAPFLSEPTGLHGVRRNAVRCDHITPPTGPEHPNLPPPMPPAPAPDVVPVTDPELPEHPDPVKEPPSYQPPVSMGKVLRAAKTARPPRALAH